MSLTAAELHALAIPCPRCGVDVLAAPALARVLEVDPTLLGVFLPESGGRRKTVREAVAGVPGHHEHRCAPAAQMVLELGRPR